ncbi:ABC transporter permease [Paenibacillus arenosi]|uniref:ABC transporter permease n=1 Tax=Paenibacillus arenosi TaxID=2774142 RepID=A0ABR9B6R0_9BACL|nr:ABC transporter permease [Paenibacillus arenosi]MBD8500856.1 ABC transporter permease [Paenibacillus arenosi]
MTTILYTELLKCKRASILWIIAAVIVIPSLISFFIGFGSWAILDSPPKWSGFLVFSQSLINMLIGPPVFAMLASFLFAREYQEGTVHSFFLYPRHRALFFLGKLCILLLLITAIIGITFLISLGIGFMFTTTHLPYDLFIGKVWELLKIIGLQFLLAPIAILAGVLSRQIIAGIIVGIVGVTSSVILMIASTPLQYSVYNPYSFVTFIIDSPLESSLMIRGFGTLMTLSIVCTAISYYHYVSSDVQGSGV